MLLVNLFSDNRFISSASLFYSQVGTLGHIGIGFALIVLPLLFIFYAEEIFWSLVWFKHCFRLRALCHRRGVAVIGENTVLIPKVAEKNFNLENYHRGGIFGTNPGNFLSLAYGVESSLRMIASQLSGKKVTETCEEDDLDDILSKAGVLTTSGKKKIRMIRWIRESVANGKAGLISKRKLSIVTQMAWDFYRELNFWLRENLSKEEKRAAKKKILAV